MSLKTSICQRYISSSSRYSKYLAIAMTIASLSAQNSSLAANYDPGGNPAVVMAQVSAARHGGEAIEIKGICYSSCALKLAGGSKMCVSPSSQIGVHEVRNASRTEDYQRGTRNELWTAFFQGMLPACARDLFNARRGFTGGQLTVVSGSDILHACPAIHACGA